MGPLLALTIVTGQPAPATVTHPGFVDVPQLQAVCDAEGSDAAAARALCLGYVTGAVDQVLAHPSQRRRPTVCPPAGLTPGAALEVVLRYRHIAKVGKGIGAADYVRFALERAYPCAAERSGDAPL